MLQKISFAWHYFAQRLDFAALLTLHSRPKLYLLCMETKYTFIQQSWFFLTDITSDPDLNSHHADLLQYFWWIKHYSKGQNKNVIILQTDMYLSLKYNIFQATPHSCMNSQAVLKEKAANCYTTIHKLYCYSEWLLHNAVQLDWVNI